MGSIVGCATHMFDATKRIKPDKIGLGNKLGKTIMYSYLDFSHRPFSFVRLRLQYPWLHTRNSLDSHAPHIHGGGGTAAATIDIDSDPVGYCRRFQRLVLGLV